MFILYLFSSERGVEFFLVEIKQDPEYYPHPYKLQIPEQQSNIT
jgi:hypothetical protein